MKRRVALDSMIFIYHLEQTEPYFQLVQRIFSAAQRGEVELITSMVSITETLSAPKYLQLSEVVREIDLFFKEADFLSIYSLDWEIAHEAARLRRENKILRTPDAIQLATAVVAGADTFITNDRKLRKIKIASLKIKAI